MSVSECFGLGYTLVDFRSLCVIERSDSPFAFHLGCSSERLVILGSTNRSRFYTQFAATICSWEVPK